MPYLLDADWVINALAGRRRAADILEQLTSGGVGISWITVGEIYEQAFRSSNPSAYIESFNHFLLPFRILGVNGPIMERFAELRALLRRQGALIPDFDILLAATALHYNLTVLTFNIRHLSRIPDLHLYQP